MRSSHAPFATVLSAMVVTLFPSTACTQTTITDALSFLMTNRSISTGDFVGDAEAARATSDAIAALLKSELAAVPVSASASGFTYRMDPALGGVPVRSTATFGAFVAQRALTLGDRHLSFGATYQGVTFDHIDGRNLRDGSLVATATQLKTDTTPFDVETVTLRIHTETITVSANYGVTDRLDIGGALPLQRLSLSGARIDTYRKTPLPQAAVAATASGPGDLLLRTKFHLWQRRATGLAVGGDARLPTGTAANLLGAGRAMIIPRVIWSIENRHVALDTNMGYGLGGLSDELDYGTALTTVGTGAVTIVGELAGRRLMSAARLIDVTAPNLRLSNVDTMRLSAVAAGTNRALVTAGVKWNMRATWLLTANVSRPLGTAGLTARWMSTIGAEYAFGE